MKFYSTTGNKSIIKDSTVSDSNVIQGTIAYFDKEFDKTSGFLSLSNEEKIIDKIMKMLADKPLAQHKCKNCGASLDMDIDDHIFKCGYCGTVYFIGTEMTRDR